jgi:hypothetical protein
MKMEKYPLLLTGAINVLAIAFFVIYWLYRTGVFGNENRNAS